MSDTSGDHGHDELYDQVGGVMDLMFMVVSSLVGAFGGLLLYGYYWRKGHFEEVEDIKYQMFRDEIEEDNAKVSK